MLSSSSPSSSSLQLAPLVLEASPNTKNMKRACIKSFRNSDTLGSQNHDLSSGTNFLVQENVISPLLISDTHCQPTLTKWDN